MEQGKLIMQKKEPGFMGVSADHDGIRVQAVLHGKKSCGLFLYPKQDPAVLPIRIDFDERYRHGDVYSLLIKNFNFTEYSYTFHEDGMPVMDQYTRKLEGHYLYGEEHLLAGKEDLPVCCAFTQNDFLWGDDQCPGTSYEDGVYYGIHIRGFTQDPSSGIVEKGTYLGVQKKIPYFKRLGITGLVVQPLYEFDECGKSNKKPGPDLSSRFQKPGLDVKQKINYWGYQKGYYFAPKNAYSFSKDSVKELKTLIRSLHKNGMEIILQFYFEPETETGLIRQVLEYWSMEYHVDGFHILGKEVDLPELSENPFLKRNKLWSEFQIGQITGKKDNSADKTMAVCNRSFQDTIRCFLKGDENMLQPFLLQLRNNPSEYGVINYLATHNGFRLMDLVSYERKHNEENGENNQDGENYNCSWNCGQEGQTKKRNILALRSRLIKNALCFLFLSQGTPMIFMGDECGKSEAGNNNPYCQDSPVTWKQWKLGSREKEILDFTIEMISLRKKHRILHRRKECMILDTENCGFPDLSFHGKEAWKPDFSYYVRHIGVMLCGLYENEQQKPDNSFYFLFNMHWELHEFAMPKLPEGKQWQLFMDTDRGYLNIDLPEYVPDQKADTRGTAEVQPRSVKGYISVEDPSYKKKHLAEQHKRIETLQIQ